MKLFPLAFFLLAFNFLYSQEKPIIGIEVQPKLTIFTQNSNDLVEADPKTSFSIAGNIYIKLKPKLSLKTGLSLHSIRLNIKDFSPRFGCDSDGNGGVDIMGSWNSFEFPLVYFGIPVQLKWDLSEEEKHFYLKAGVETLLRLSSQGNHEVIQCGTSAISVNGTLGGLSPVLIMTDLGIGYEIPFKEGKKFYIEPTIEYSLSALFDGDKPIIFDTNIPTNGNLLNIGLTAGILF